MSSPSEQIGPERIRSLDNNVPFVQELIPFLPDGISKKFFNELVSQSHTHDLSYMGAQTDRNLEQSGILINLEDVCHSKEDAMSYLLPLATYQIVKINGENPELQQQIWSTLAGSTCTPDALVYLDGVFGEMIKDLKQFRGPIFDAIRERKLQLLDVYQARSIVYYPHFNENDRLVSVIHANTIPPFPPEMKNMLLAIRPDFLDPKAIEYPVKTERGFLQIIGKFGHPFTRELARYAYHVLHVSDFETREQHAIEAMRAYVESHG
jgi:hypothetical protein